MSIQSIAKSLFAWLNGLGAIVLGFALVNPDARALFSDALQALPEPWRTIVGIVIAMAWYAIVQAAQRREIKKAAS